MAEEVKLRVRDNNGETVVLEQLNGEDALTYTAETPEEAANLLFFPVGKEITCGFLLNAENPVESRIYLVSGDIVVANFEIPKQ